MQVSLNPSEIKNWNGSALIAGLFEDGIKEQLNQLGFTSDSILIRLEEIGFSAKQEEIASFEILDGQINKLILVGLGKPEKLTIDSFRQATAIGGRASQGIKGNLGIILPWDLFDQAFAAKVVAESIRLSMFKDLRFRSDPDPINNPEKIELLGLSKVENSVLSEVSSICSGVELARELVGAPPNRLTPSELAKTAVSIGKTYNLESEVLEEADCEKKGMGAYLAVSKGSDLPPKFIHLTYKPKGDINHRVALIGKGLTFDSGGYNLKVGAAQIEMMKFDMGGSASVLGAARAIAEIRPKGIEVHFIIAACENMVNGSAVHPGDIVKASNGKTIEINNTDAEGRLTLADALVYACALKPDAIVDLATLTGACVIALGDDIAGLWTESDGLAKELTNSAKDVGEGLWRMPLPNSYKKGLKSMLADIKNTGPRAGGSITAALFLREFVDSSIKWAHIDIAGTVWSDKDKGLSPAGATGYGVRTLVSWILGYSN